MGFIHFMLWFFTWTGLRWSIGTSTTRITLVNLFDYCCCPIFVESLVSFHYFTTSFTFSGAMSIVLEFAVVMMRVNVLAKLFVWSTTDNIRYVLRLVSFRCFTTFDKHITRLLYLGNHSWFLILCCLFF